jgi:hypothetical protein
MLRTRRLVERIEGVGVVVEITYSASGAAVVWAAPEGHAVLGCVHAAAACSTTRIHDDGDGGSTAMAAEEANQAMAERLIRARGAPPQLFVCCSALFAAPAAALDPRFVPQVEHLILRALRDGGPESR